MITVKKGRERILIGRCASSSSHLLTAAKCTGSSSTDERCDSLMQVRKTSQPPS
jgi:hypothetical protein